METSRRSHSLTVRISIPKNLSAIDKVLRGSEGVHDLGIRDGATRYRGDRQVISRFVIRRTVVLVAALGVPVHHPPARLDRRQFGCRSARAKAADVFLNAGNVVVLSGGSGVAGDRRGRAVGGGRRRYLWRRGR